MDSEKKVLLGMSLDELKSAVKALGMPQFTAGQIVKWLYQQHVRSIDEMTNISKANRERLSEQFVIPSIVGAPWMAPSSICFLWLVAINSLRRSIFLTAIVPRSACRARWAVR